MPGIALKVLRGLKTLRFLKAFRLTYFFDEWRKLVMNSAKLYQIGEFNKFKEYIIYLVITIIKSSTFQGSRI
jgi:hypothetical protein